MGGLPPGFRFFPSDEELVVHFLYRKASLLPCHPDIIPSLNLRHVDPWDLDGKALQGGNQWYFFTQRIQNRVSPNGYWVPVGIDDPITSSNRVVGMKKTLVFYIGQAPCGVKTDWVMLEYHLMDGSTNCSTSGSSTHSKRRSSRKRGHHRMVSENWVICRVYEASCDSVASFYSDETELSCLDEVFLSLDDLDEISLPD